MSHDINYNNTTGRYAFMSVKEKAWHGLGQIITAYPTSAEAILHAGLDYMVEKRPLFTVDQVDFGRFKAPDADDYSDELQPGILVPDYYANVRTDTEEVLGVVGRIIVLCKTGRLLLFLIILLGGRTVFYMKLRGH